MTLDDSRIAQSPDIASSTLGDDTIIMSTLDSTLFVLNSVGTAIWKAADGVTPLSRIVEEKICAEFDVSGDVALADAKQFVEKLAEHGILRISPDAAPHQENV